MLQLAKDRITMEQDERQGGTSASNAAADRGCAGRHFAQVGLPEVRSKDSDFGSQIHDALYNESPEGLKPDQIAIYEQCLEVRGAAMLNFFGPEADSATIIKERRFFVRVLPVSGQQEGERYKHSARLDFLARLGNRLLILEYKTLPGDVPASPQNEQLRDQAAICVGNLQMTNIPDYEVGVGIVQPLVTHNVEVCVYKPAHIKRAESEMFARVRSSNDPNGKRTPNTISCKFCKAKFTCLEHAVWAESMLPATARMNSGLPVSQWTPEMRAQFCEIRSVAQKWLDDCEAEMKRMLREDATAIPGWRLEEGNTIETVDDPQGLFTKFIEIAKDFAKQESPGNEQALITALFMDCVKVGKKDFEAIVRKVSGLKGKQLHAQMLSLYEGLTSSRQNQPSLGRSPEQPTIDVS